MERVYLLLRNNQQSGPFTIGELLQQHVLPSDMIWIEGKSTVWTYLSELELIPFVASRPASEKKPEIKGKDEIERKAEELRQRILSSTPRSFFEREVEVETYASPHKLDDDIDFVDRRKQKRQQRSVVVGELALTCAVIGIFAVGIYKGKAFLAERNKVPVSIATKLETHDEHAARNKKIVVASQPVAKEDSAQKVDSSLLATTMKQKPKPLPVIHSMDSNKIKINPIIPDPATTETDKKDPVLKLPVTKVIDQTPLKKEAVIPQPKQDDATDQPEKKRSFLGGLFKKKKKDNNSDNQ